MSTVLSEIGLLPLRDLRAFELEFFTLSTDVTEGLLSPRFLFSEETATSSGELAFSVALSIWPE